MLADARTAPQVNPVLDGHSARRKGSLSKRMSYLKRIRAREQAGRIKQRAAGCAHRLNTALQLASRRAARSSRTVRALYASATVAGLARGGRIRAGVISFCAPPFVGGLHQFWAWQQVERMSDAEVASLISQSLRRSLKERR